MPIIIKRFLVLRNLRKPGGVGNNLQQSITEALNFAIISNHKAFKLTLQWYMRFLSEA